VSAYRADEGRSDEARERSCMRRGTFVLGAAATGAAAFGLAHRVGALASPAALQLGTVRVRLFSGLNIVSLDIAFTAQASINGTSQPPGIVRVLPNTAPATIASTSPLTLTARTSGGETVVRTYAGNIRVAAVAGGGIQIVNTVDDASYVSSVLASEISPSWHPQALKAQAMAIRTYALRRVQRYASRDFDVTDDTSNQVYKGIGIVQYPAFADAARTTAGMVVLFDGAPADVWYHSACGGHTASSQEITGVAAPPYLGGIVDADAGGHAYCSASPYFRWRNQIDAASVARLFALASVDAVSIDQRWPDGRAKSMHAAASGAQSADLDARVFYTRAGDLLGYKVIPSTLFGVAPGTGGAFVFTGNGVGHGVGMCQWGARGRADAGQTAAQIIAAYYPGTIISTAAASDG
jgi:SpoIID/LytB domain protein